MNALWNVCAADDVLRVGQRSGLGRECVALCADCLVRVVGSCSDSACSLRCEVSGDSRAHAHDCFVWRLPCARCWVWFETLREVTGAESEVILTVYPWQFCAVAVSCSSVHHLSKWYLSTLPHRIQCAVSAAFVVACMMPVAHFLQPKQVAVFLTLARVSSR